MNSQGVLPTALGIPGLAELRGRTKGDPAVVIAIIDGRIAQAHPCFSGAAIQSPQGWVSEPAEGATANHGTYVASLICGQPDTELEGLAPGCTMISLPAWTPEVPHPSQLDLARAIEAAVAAGAHVINVSGGQYVDEPGAQDFLIRAVQHCVAADVLLVAAAGNDGCDCLHVPAGLDGVLAVGSHGETVASTFSNHHPAYLKQGLSAPGEAIVGAKLGGGTQIMSGTSAAAPIVAASAALLLSLARAEGRELSPRAVGRALLDGGSPCAADTDTCRRLLGRTLNIEGARTTMNQQADLSGAAQSCGCGRMAVAAPAFSDMRAEAMQAPVDPRPFALDDKLPAAVAGSVTQSGHPVLNEGALVYALGSLGFDFGTEARRDSFKQLMAPAVFDGLPVPPNPYDARQLVQHLRRMPSEARSLIWTLNLELTPIYAVEAVGPYAMEVNDILVGFLAGGNVSPVVNDYVERISVPGMHSGRSVRLFSGQVVPVVEVDSPRGLYGWQAQQLIANALNDMGVAEDDRAASADNLRTFLDRVYYELRNLGRLSQDRAVNFAATNAFQAARVFADAVARGMRLDTVSVERSPYARPESDAWDVHLKFFDPENLRRAREVFRFTIDVSDVMPVTMGTVRNWSVSS